MSGVFGLWSRQSRPGNVPSLSTEIAVDRPSMRERFPLGWVLVGGCLMALGGAWHMSGQKEQTDNTLPRADHSEAGRIAARPAPAQERRQREAELGDGDTEKGDPGESPGSAKPAGARDAARALHRAKLDLKRQCWNPLVRAVPEPSTSEHRLVASFEPSGRLSSFEFADVEGRSRADVAQCLSEVELDVQSGPFKGPVDVAIRFRFP